MQVCWMPRTRRMHLTVDARIGLFLEVVAAAARAHSHSIVHRDIKPPNIFVTGCQSPAPTKAAMACTSLKLQ
jgi:serine/threonine protein kinase